MLWFFLSLILLAGLLLWLPLQVEVDTENGLYRAGWGGIFGVRATMAGDRWQWFYRIFFWEKQAMPDGKKARAGKTRKPKAKKPSFPLSPRQAWFLMKKLLRAVEVKRFYLDWDTGDFIWDAYLYPLCRLTRANRHVHINFSGRQELAIHLQARPYRLAGAALQAFFHSK